MVTGYELDLLRAMNQQAQATVALAEAVMDLKIQVSNLKDAVILAIAKLSAEVND